MTDNTKEEIREERLIYLHQLLETEKEKLKISERNYYNNSGYGKRTGGTKHEKQIKLIELAIKGVEYRCSICELHFKNALNTLNAMKDEQKNGVTSVPIERVIAIINMLM